MRTGIEQARIELVKWETIAKQDRDALAAAEQQVLLFRLQVERSSQTVRSLKDAVDKWDAMHTRQQPSTGVER